MIMGVHPPPHFADGFGENPAMPFVNPDMQFWREAEDAKTGKKYYYHIKTKDVQWRKPIGFLSVRVDCLFFLNNLIVNFRSLTLAHTDTNTLNVSRKRRD
jgi:hypothetical protein